MLTRDTALVDNEILLVTQFFDNEGSLIDVSEVNYIEIYDENPANNATPIATITSIGITHTSTGTYSYIVGPYSQTGKYYDKVYYTPFEGADTAYVVNSFTLREITGSSSLGLDTCRVYGTVVNSSGEPIEGAVVAVNKVNFQAEQSNKIVAYQPLQTTTDENGFFEIYVLTSVELAISIPAIGYRRVFKLSSGTTEKNITQIDSWLYSPVDNPGEDSDYLGSSSGIVRPSSTGYSSDFQNEQNMPVFDWDNQ